MEFRNMVTTALYGCFYIDKLLSTENFNSQINLKESTWT